MSQLSEQQQLEKQKKSMDKFLYEKNVEDLIVEIRDFKRKPECKETFLKDLDNVIKFYKINECSGQEPNFRERERGGANKSKYKKLKRIYKKTKKVKRFNSRRNKK
jgi:hypothetical protein